MSQVAAFPSLNYSSIRQYLLQGIEIAIVDLREEHIFAQGHPLFSTNVSLSRLEVEIYNRIPRLDTIVVIYDDGEGLVERAYPRLIELGYLQLYVLEGGLKGWQQQGGELFIDVNSASKAFGEWVEHFKHTPSLSAEEVQAKIDQKDNVVIVDARRYDEYNTMNIPTSISVPGAELVLRAPKLVKDENTTIIVNCAGRTRSIIGTQSLVNAKIGHEVYALRNGTIGWTLANQGLEHGQTRRYEDFVDVSTFDEVAIQRAKAVADQAGVGYVTLDELRHFQADIARTTYVFDVRSEAEYITGHLANSRWIAGGQLVQETDHYAATRGARIVLVDDHLARAYMTASWLAQMNWDVFVLQGDIKAHLTETGAWRPTTAKIEQDIPFIDAHQLNATLETSFVIDVSALVHYKKGHIPSAHWALKADLARIVQETDLSAYQQIVLTCRSSLLAQYGVADIQHLTHLPVKVLQGGTLAWQAIGLDLEQRPSILSEEIDRYKRPYEGTDNSREAMQAYLDWEFGLVDQLKTDATHGFYVI